MGDLAAARVAGVRRPRSTRRARRCSGADTPADRVGVRPRLAVGLRPARRANRLRHHRAALRERVRPTPHGHARRGGAPRARRRLRRRPAGRPRARVRHLPLRLDAGRQPPALAALEDGAPRRRNRRRSGSREPRGHVVALSLRHTRGADRPERFRARRPCRPRLSADGGRDDRDARRLRRDALSRLRVRPAALHGAAAPGDLRDGHECHARRLGAEQHARRRGRAPDHRRQGRARSPPRPAGRDRPAHLHPHARLEAGHLVPAGRAVLDVPVPSRCRRTPA